jgi:3-deoxy-7-phosphoheptulonate synthase
MGEHIFGKSITDPCLGWEKTEKLILDIADKL